MLERIAAGDQRAVAECLAEYGGLVWSIARRLSKTTADAEDATQEVFVELWQKASRFDPTVASEATYITMIARRRLIDRLRRTRTTLDVESVASDSIDVADPRLDNRSDLNDEAAKAANCLKGLADQQQRVLTLSIHHGVSHTAIAEKLSIPLGSVKTYARRGLIQLRDCMKRRMLPQAEGSAS